MNKKKNTPPPPQRDCCVACGEETSYDKDDHIDKRYNYVEGAGQLCLKCWDSIYGTNTKPN